MRKSVWLFWLLLFMSRAAQGEIAHPGILVDFKQLRYIKENIYREPWKSAYERALQDPLADKAYEPTPWATVECGSYSNPNNGCSDEIRDARAAYTQALLWRLSGDPRYAENVRKILNAWAETLTGGHTNSNGPLQAAWGQSCLLGLLRLSNIPMTDGPNRKKTRLLGCLRGNIILMCYVLFLAVMFAITKIGMQAPLKRCSILLYSIKIKYGLMTLLRSGVASFRPISIFPQMARVRKTLRGAREATRKSMRTGATLKPT